MMSDESPLVGLYHLQHAGIGGLPAVIEISTRELCEADRGLEDEAETVGLDRLWRNVGC